MDSRSKETLKPVGSFGRKKLISGKFSLTTF